MLDAVGCALLSLNFPECTKLLGPVVPGALGGPHGASVVGTAHELDPVTAAHNFATAIRWLDYNDAWCASEWVHPSDVVGAILPLSEYLSKVRMARHLPPLTMRDVVTATIKAYEIMGILATENSLNAIGVDGILFTRVACAVCRGCRGGRREVADAASQASPTATGCGVSGTTPTSDRERAGRGDAASRVCGRAPDHARRARAQPGAHRAGAGSTTRFSAKRSGVEARLKRTSPKTSCSSLFPAETHAQTAVEASFLLHPQVVHRVDEIHSVVIHTTRAAVRVIDEARYESRRPRPLFTTPSRSASCTAC